MGAKLTGIEGRRGICRVALSFAVLALVSLSAGCGASGDGSGTDSERAADVEILNSLLSQELTLVDAYELGLAPLRGPMRAVAEELHSQSQAHVDAITKAIRGLGGESDAEAGEVGPPQPRSRRSALTLAYEEENTALADALGAAPRLQSGASRTLAASLVASHAQHLVVLRQGLGVGLAASVPAPFETGDQPPPGPPAAEQG